MKAPLIDVEHASSQNSIFMRKNLFTPYRRYGIANLGAGFFNSISLQTSRIEAPFMKRETLGGRITNKEPVLLRLHDVLKMLGVSRSTWFSGVAKGFYPEPLRISKGCVVWRVDDIKKLIINEPVLSTSEVLELIPISRSTWFQGVKDGRYPKPVVVPGKGKKWKLSDIRKFIESLSSKIS